MKIEVWYHCILSGPRVPNSDYAVRLLQEQMIALRDSRLLDEADEFYIGINGGYSDALLASAMSPCARVQMLVNGPEAQTELATLARLQALLKPGRAVFYHHIKGVQHPNDKVYDRWRTCMTDACVWNWRECHMLLDSGHYDTVGAHWLTQKQYPMVGKDQRYWGGNFWWATSDYLQTLPKVAPDTQDNRYEAEVWIGQGPRAPRIYDFRPHWPLSCP